MKIKYCCTNNHGLTLIEIIMSIAILGIVICPLMSLMIFSQKINNDGMKELKSLQQAQKYMEEIKSMNELDTENYSYNSQSNTYEKIIMQTNTEYKAEIKIKPVESSILYDIEILIKDDDEIIKTLVGSKIFN
jgi:prepilin-type N-terminal cleavage/methylation domain-containing protein